MQFAPDTVETLEFAVALCNTHPGASRMGEDELADIDALSTFLDTWRYSGRRDADEAELAEVRVMRDRLRRLWGMPRDGAVAEVNAVLRQGRALPYLFRHDGSDWHLHATELDAPLAERIGVEVALAVVDVIRGQVWGRMRRCAAADCDAVLVDLSRNGSKRFCSVRCSNRVNMIAFRQRRSERQG